MVQIPNYSPFMISRAGYPSDFLKDVRIQPFFKLDKTIEGGWSLIYASIRAKLVFKVPFRPKKMDRESATQMIEDERRVLERLPMPCRLVTPRFYGEFEWPGGRALAFSYGGPSLAHQGLEFSSLPLRQRCVLSSSIHHIVFNGIH